MSNPLLYLLLPPLYNFKRSFNYDYNKSELLMEWPLALKTDLCLLFVNLLLVLPYDFTSICTLTSLAEGLSSAADEFDCGCSCSFLSLFSFQARKASKLNFLCLILFNFSSLFYYSKLSAVNTLSLLFFSSSLLPSKVGQLFSYINLLWKSPIV